MASRGWQPLDRTTHGRAFGRPQRCEFGSRGCIFGGCYQVSETSNGPAVIDQLKQVHIEGELAVVDTPLWHAKVARKDYQVGMNLTGVAVDDPDANMVENYSCKSERNYHELLQPRSREADRRTVGVYRQGGPTEDRLAD
jgi:hypothetical protein